MVLHQGEGARYRSAARWGLACRSLNGCLGHFRAHKQGSNLKPQGRAMVLTNQIHHQVKGRHSAGAGNPVAVLDVAQPLRLNLGEILGKAGQFLPMDGSLPPLQKTGRSQEPGPGIKAGHDGIASGRSPQPTQHRLGAKTAIAIAGQGDQHFTAAIGKPGVGAHLHPRRRRGRSPIQRDKAPGIKRTPGQGIGSAHRLNCIGQAVTREIIKEQQVDLLHCGVIFYPTLHEIFQICTK